MARELVLLPSREDATLPPQPLPGSSGVYFQKKNGPHPHNICILEGVLAAARGIALDIWEQGGVRERAIVVKITPMQE